MAKRFIDTSFYKSPFVRGLGGALKGLYSFIICDCDNSGIWSADFEIASVYIGLKVSKKDFEEAFLITGKAIDLNNGKYFFPDFIQHQYPKGLSEKNPAQINIILDLKKYNLIDENLKIITIKTQDPSEPLKRGIGIGKGTGLGNGIGKGNNGEKQKKEIPTEIEFLEYCQEILKEKYIHLEFSLKSKYRTWFDDGWKTGHNKPIKNWKNTITNTIPFLKPIANGSKQNTENRNERVNSVTNLKNLAERILDDHAAKNSS